MRRVPGMPRLPPAIRSLPLVPRPAAGWNPHHRPSHVGTLPRVRLLADPGERAAGDFTPAFMTASSMAALNMGVYYVLAALADWRAFFRWTVPFRLLTCTVFVAAAAGGRAPDVFVGVGAWEAAGAAATAAALLRERRRGAGRLRSADRSVSADGPHTTDGPESAPRR
ncbi:MULTISPECIES: hypothetical protein [Streptomyces]|uniref:hypothetical protein n=1 Tax=Streptomyces TaxID=1883 RepID=UPI003F4CD0C5